MIDSTFALAALRALADQDKAVQMAAYHKVPRVYLGVTVPEIDALTRDWRAALALEDRLALATELWDSNIHEARVAAARLLTQARIRPDDSGAWALICTWVPDFDAWALADHACIAGQKRLVADPARVGTVAGWTQSPHLWTRRAALVITLPWAKMNFPKQRDIEIREEVLDWAAGLLGDRDWFIQKAVAWWLRDLSKHDAARARAFLEAHGSAMAGFARREAARYL